MRYMLADNAAAIFCGGSMISNQAVSLSKQPMVCIRDCVYKDTTTTVSSPYFCFFIGQLSTVDHFYVGMLDVSILKI